MGRKQSPVNTAPTEPKPKIFVGSAAESLPVARALAASLDRIATPILWTIGFEPSTTTLHSLESRAAECRFAVFIFTPDDVTIIRKAKYRTTRDNVIWEHGLFSGKNRVANTFVLAPRDTPSLKLPTDLHGLTLLTYDPTLVEDDMNSAITSANHEITEAIKRVLKAESKSVQQTPEALPRQSEDQNQTSLVRGIQSTVVID